MKCDVCGKEISEEESYKGCCKECASKIFDRIENKRNDSKSFTEIDSQEKDIKKIKSKENTKNIIIAVLIIVVLITVPSLISYVNSYSNSEDENVKLKADISNYTNEIEYKDKRISSLENSVAYYNSDEYKETINNLNNEISTLTTQRDSLKSEVSQLEGTPQNYSAGYYTAGTNFPTGRYKIYNGNSNFVVRSSYGDLKVNIILGDSSYHVTEYIYDFSTGDQIEADSSFTIIKIQE